MPERQASGRIFKAGGTHSFVRELGEGEPVVMFHGVPVSSFVYRKLIAPIASGGLRAVAFDLPGLGLAARPADFDYSLKGLINFAGSAIDCMELERCHLVVHDIGGPIGCGWAATHPERVLSLTVLNTTLRLSAYRDPWMLAAFNVPGLRRLWLRMMTRPIFTELFYRDGIAKRDSISRDEVRAHYSLLRFGDGGRAFLKINRAWCDPAFEQPIIAALNNRDYPAQLIWGEHDPVLGQREREFVMRALGVDQALLLPAKHFLQEECAAPIADAVLEIAAQARAA